MTGAIIESAPFYSGATASGMRHHVADHLVHVPALRVEVGVWVVFRDAPHAVALVPECGPPRVLLQDGGKPHGFLGPGQAGHRVTGLRAISTRSACSASTSASSRRTGSLAGACSGRAVSVFSSSRR